MLTLNMFLSHILLPGLIALAVFSIPLLRRKREYPSWAGGLGTGLPFILTVGYAMTNPWESYLGWYTFPPRVTAPAEHWVPYVAIGFTISGLLLTAFRATPLRLVGLLGVLGILAVMGVTFAYPMRTAMLYQMGEGWDATRIAWLASLGGAWLLLMLVPAGVSHRVAGPAPAVGLMAAAMLGTLAMSFAGSARYGNSEAILVAGCVGALLVALIRRHQHTVQAPMVVAFVGIHGLLWMMLYFYGDAPNPVAAVLGAISPLGLAVLLVPKVKRMGWVWQSVLTGGTSALLAGASLAITLALKKDLSGY
jgi:hypothetical protein